MLSFSPALCNFVAESGSWKNAFDNGAIDLYTGSKPATADLAPTGTLLCTITSGSAAQTNETRATGVITLTVGATTGDTVTTFTLAGLEIKGATTVWNTSLTQMAADCALAINRCPSNLLVTATSSGAVITLTALPGVGTYLNGKTIAVGVGGNMVATITSTTMGSGSGGGVAGVAAANGLRMDYNVAAGVFTKDTTQTWSGTAVGAGTQTAGWFRYRSSLADAGALDSATPPVYMRMDGTVGTSGADMNMTNTAVANGAPQVLSSFSFAIPAA